MRPEDKLKELNLTIPSSPKPLGSYKPLSEVGNLIFVSGTLPIDSQGKMIKGRLGKDLSIEEGKEATKLCALNSLSVLKSFLNELSRIQSIVRAVGHILSTPDFDEHAQVMNGASDLLAQVFGEKGRHARLALGANSLPKGASVELELIIRFE